MKVFACWSGGKESSLACYRAIREGLKVTYLINMIREDASRSMSHGLPSELIAAQAKAIGIPIVQRRTTWDLYEQDFKAAILELKAKGVSGGVFGDIDLQEHRDWTERICEETGIKPYLPLWGEDQREILEEFVRAGFETIVVATRADLLGKSWLGRKINMDFLKEILEHKSVTPCGEAGEYHTFVTCGPLFKRRIEITRTKEVLRDGHWFLDILEWKIS